jgi:CheY-like chemotaxis protein
MSTPHYFKRVAIIDDDFIFRNVFEMLLVAENFAEHIQNFDHSALALDFLKSNPTKEELPELLFLDINMPVLDGWQFLEEFLQLEPKPDISVVMMSSSIDQCDLEKAKSYQDHLLAYIPKPPTESDLQTLIALARKQPTS